jgi:hypothetical protein
MAVDENQNMIISGTFSDSTDFDGIKVVGGNPGTFLAKFDSSGAVQWAATYSGSSGGVPYLQFMPNGKLATVLRAADIRMLNPDGSIYWSRNIGNALVTALTVGPKGELNMAFSRQDSASFPPYRFTGQPSMGQGYSHR